ncbi:hypothetical protein [Labrys neptuniae]
MSVNLDITQICNLALDYLDEAPLASIDDNSAVARWFRRNFWPVAWSLMRKHPWNFACARALLPASATPPAFGWRYGYELPIDCLRVLPLTADGRDGGKPVDHKIEGTQILTDEPAPRPVRYIARIDNTGRFDQQFTDVLATALAQKAAHLITGKASYAAQLGQTLQALMQEAQAIDALEGTPDDPSDDFWIEARQ